ncbi:unnamed protein product [Symbiodinium natans]|uniref:Uncharacterized protein n=1 Tax=Symbiodinium natans TaxID=878477 RepID=A0A812V1Z3_9DINO|nr:unnamed protein product [Symbiodinium natans]
MLLLRAAQPSTREAGTVFQIELGGVQSLMLEFRHSHTYTCRGMQAASKGRPTVARQHRLKVTRWSGEPGHRGMQSVKGMGHGDKAFAPWPTLRHGPSVDSPITGHKPLALALGRKAPRPTSDLTLSRQSSRAQALAWKTPGAKISTAPSTNARCGSQRLVPPACSTSWDVRCF